MNLLALDYPIKSDGCSISALALRDFTIRDLKWLRDHPVVKVDRAFWVELLGRLSDLPASVIEQLDLADYVRVTELSQEILEVTNRLLPDQCNEFLMDLAIEVMEATGRTSAEVFSMPLRSVLNIRRAQLETIPEPRSRTHTGLHS